MNFKEWINIKETGSPGFSVNRTAMPARPYAINPYSFMHGQIQDPDEYLAAKRLQIPKDIAHHTATQINQGWNAVKDVQSLNRTSIDGGGGGFVSAHHDDPSIIDWLFKRNSGGINTTSLEIQLPNTNELLSKKINHAIKVSKEELLNNLQKQGISVDLSTIHVINKTMLPNNKLQLQFGYKLQGK